MKLQYVVKDIPEWCRKYSGDQSVEYRTNRTSPSLYNTIILIITIIIILIIIESIPTRKVL